MPRSLMPLPYASTALAPHYSKEAIDYHYGKHHKNYVETLSTLEKGTPFENVELEEVVRGSSGEIFNNAAQIWNHDCFWKSMTPDFAPLQEGLLATAIAKQWTSRSAFEETFANAASKHFGSGWAWLVASPSGELAIRCTSNAATPSTGRDVPLFTVDLWEHAYYLDYRNERKPFVETFLQKLVDWEFATRNFSRLEDRERRATDPIERHV